MKKVIGILSALIIGIGTLLSAHSGYAFDGGEHHGKNDHAWHGMRHLEQQEFMAYVKEYKQEFHQMNKLHIEALDYKKELLQNHDKLMDLIPKADDAKELEAEVKPIKDEMAKNHDQMRKLHMDLGKEFMAFQTAAKNKQTGVAKEHLAQMIKIKTELNGLLKERAALYDKLVSAYQND